MRCSYLSVAYAPFDFKTMPPHGMRLGHVIAAGDTPMLRYERADEE
jgi:hypothetical protein